MSCGALLIRRRDIASKKARPVPSLKRCVILCICFEQKSILVLSPWTPPSLRARAPATRTAAAPTTARRRTASATRRAPGSRRSLVAGILLSRRFSYPIMLWTRSRCVCFRHASSNFLCVSFCFALNFDHCNLPRCLDEADEHNADLRCIVL